MGQNRAKKFQKIKDFTNEQNKDYEIFKVWILDVEKKFFGELQVLPILNLDLTGNISNEDFDQRANVAKTLISEYLKDLENNCQNKDDIPPEVINRLLRYTKHKNYYPKDYLTSYEVHRLNFNYLGESSGKKPSTKSMLTSMLLISRITVQHLLMKIKQIFEETKDFQYIEQTCKTLGSLLHYLVQITFFTSPKKLMEVIPIINYNKIYGIKDPVLENAFKSFDPSKLKFTDIETLGQNLVPKKDLSKFFQQNEEWIIDMTVIIKNWTSKLVQFLK